MMSNWAVIDLKILQAEIVECQRQQTNLATRLDPGSYSELQSRIDLLQEIISLSKPL